jgi:3-deoxy-D-manno-octulosonic-acid transferase
LTVKRFVVSETELWPILLHEVARRDIPAYVVNGRISDYTLRWYEQIESLVEPLMRGFRSICVPNKMQADRYIALGAQPEAVVVTGHSKYDTDPRITSDEERVSIRRELFPKADGAVPIVVLGSIRPGEERYWFDAFAGQRQRGAKVKMVVAPRHAERFSYFSEQLTSTGLPFARWSERDTWGEVDNDIVLLDTMGKLEEAYAVASLAFVGATLVDVGGHNPIEPAMYAAPVVVGPYISVIEDVIDEMRGCAGVIEVSSASDIATVVERVVKYDPKVTQVGMAGRGVWQRHRGAAQRIASAVRDG